MEDVVESFKRYNTEYETIDTYFKTPFKHILREKWGECIANATEEFTKQGKCRCLLQNGLLLGVWSEEDGGKIRIRRQQISAAFVYRMGESAYKASIEMTDAPATGAHLAHNTFIALLSRL